jgi:hypothetical protein
LRGWDIFIQIEPSEFVGDFRAAAAELLSAIHTSIVVNPERTAGAGARPQRMKVEATAHS